MIFLITGASHTGKTWLAQRLLEGYHIPYLSIDLLKMGLIRSGQTALSPEEDAALEAYLWPILREILHTALENRQHLHPPRPGAHPLLLPGDEPELPQNPLFPRQSLRQRH